MAQFIFVVRSFNRALFLPAKTADVFSVADLVHGPFVNSPAQITRSFMKKTAKKKEPKPPPSFAKKLGKAFVAILVSSLLGNGVAYAIDEDFRDYFKDRHATLIEALFGEQAVQLKEQPHAPEKPKISGDQVKALVKLSEEKTDATKIVASRADS